MVKILKESRRGVALLATMLAVALMTLLVVDFTTAAALGYRSAANQANEIRAEYLARSGIAVGLALLEQDSINDAKAQQDAYDGLNEVWALPYPPIAIPGGGVVSLSIVDEARKIDVNGLIDPRTHTVDPTLEEILVRLLANINAPPDFLPALIDWLDPDSIESPGGAEADYYLKLTPPYEPRNGPIPTIGDVRVIKDVDEATFARLRQFLTTVPEPRVNANTAAPEVLAALIPELENDPQLVKQIIEARAVKPFTVVTDVTNLPGVGQYAPTLSPLITTRSSYFTITGVGEYAGARKFIFATFKRDSNGAFLLISWHEY